MQSVMQQCNTVHINATTQDAKYDLHCYHWISLIGETVSDHEQVDAKILPNIGPGRASDETPLCSILMHYSSAYNETPCTAL